MNAWCALLGLGICVGGIAIACASDSDADGPCEPGNERCECYANRTCNAGLTCLSEICVDDDEADNGGSGGSGGSSGGSDSSSGGTDSDSGGSTSDSGGSTSDSGGSASDAGGSAGADGSSSGGSGAGGATTTTMGGAGGSGTGGSGTDGSGGTGGPVEGNLIQNGDFSDGDAHWDLTLSVGDPVVDAAGGAYCVQNTAEATYATFTLGYPLDLTEVFTIASGTSYVLSYRVKGYASYELKIGQAAEPYTALAGVIEDSSASDSYVTQTHTIQATLGDPEAGFAITVLLGTSQNVCFDDISLIEE